MEPDANKVITLAVFVTNPWVTAVDDTTSVDCLLPEGHEARGRRGFLRRSLFPFSPLQSQSQLSTDHCGL